MELGMVSIERRYRQVRKTAFWPYDASGLWWAFFALIDQWPLATAPVASREPYTPPPEPMPEQPQEPDDDDEAAI